MQDPVCTHPCSEVSMELQVPRSWRGTEQGGNGVMEELNPQQCPCQPCSLEPVGITGSLQSQGEARFCLLC